MHSKIVPAEIHEESFEENDTFTIHPITRQSNSNNVKFDITDNHEKSFAPKAKSIADAFLKPKLKGCNDSNEGLKTNWHIDEDEKVQDILNNAQIDMNLKQFRKNSRIALVIKDKGDKHIPLSGLLHPEDDFRGWWDMWMMSLVFYYAITTPIEIGFEKNPFQSLVLEIIFNFFFVGDIILQFFTSFYHSKGPKSGRLEKSHKVVAWRYIKSWFFVDVLASIPFSMIYRLSNGVESSSSGNANKLLRVLRSFKLFRVLRANRIFKRLLSKARISISIIRFFKLCMILMMEWHCLGCIYWAISENKGFDDLDDFWTPSSEAKDWNFAQQYLRAFIWAVNVTTGCGGEELEPQEDIQIFFTIFSIIFGVLTYAIIVGSFGSLLQTMQTLEGIKRRDLQQIVEYLHQRNCGETLVAKIKDYYDYCYFRHITTYDKKLLGEMHSTLQKNLHIELNSKLLLQVPRFQDLSQDCLLTIIQELISKIFLPDEIVYVDRERASDMYFVARGDLEQLDHTGQRLQLFMDGDFFGDEILSVSSRRRSTVRSITHSELLLLSKVSFKKMLRRFPQFGRKVAVWGYSKNIFLSSSGWGRITYVVKISRTMKRLGSNVKFKSLYKTFTGVYENAFDQITTNEMDYQTFRKTVMFTDKKGLPQPLIKTKKTKLF